MFTIYIIGVIAWIAWLEYQNNSSIYPKSSKKAVLLQALTWPIRPLFLIALNVWLNNTDD